MGKVLSLGTSPGWPLSQGALLALSMPTTRRCVTGRHDSHLLDVRLGVEAPPGQALSHR